MVVSEVVGEGGNVPRGSKLDSGVGVGRRGGAMWVGSDAGIYASQGMDVGRTTVVT